MASACFFGRARWRREVRVAELKSNFVSSVSHDLKTPLALIQLFAETLELGRLKSTERAHELLPHHQQRGAQADPAHQQPARLLENRGRPAAAIKREPVDLTELTRRVLQSLDSQFRHSQYTVTSRLDSRRAGADRPGSGRTGAREPAVERA